MNNCTIIGIDLGDKKHAVVGLDDKANVVLKRWIPNTKADLEALFRRNRRAVFGVEAGGLGFVIMHDGVFKQRT